MTELPNVRAVTGAALSLAKRGWHVFPLDHPDNARCAGTHKRCDGQRGKHPVGAWSRIATTDPQSVKDRFNGKRRNIGIACGPSGLLVIDEDQPGEFARYAESVGQAIPDTYTVRTAKGTHYYFQQPDGQPLGNAEGAFGEYGINVRGAGGYVVGPNSAHASGAVYTEANPRAEIVPAPVWLIQALRSDKPAGTGELLDQIPDPDERWWRDEPMIGPGKRHAAFVAAAGWCLEAGLSKVEAVPVLRDVFARADNADGKYSVDDALGQLDDIYGRYQPGERRKPLPATPTTDEDQFWSSRPVLAAMREFARSRRVAPWAVFGSVLGATVCQVGPQLVLPPLIGGQASLNLLIALVAESGGGKDAAYAAGCEFLFLGDDPVFTTHVINTAEGMDASYTNATKDGPVQFNDTSLFITSEIDTIEAEVRRNGSKLRARLRMFYMGEATGGKTGKRENWRAVGRHQYRGALIASVQPSRSGVLLDDADGGTPQRVLWLPTTDPGMPDQRPDPPLPHESGAVPGELQPQGSTGNIEIVGQHDRIEIEVCQTATDETDRAWTEQLRSGKSGLNSHANLTRLKVAAALALLDGWRTKVTDDDWELAALVMAKSDQTREICQKALSRQARKANRTQAVLRAEQEEVIEEHREQRAMRAAAGQAVRRVKKHHVEHPEGSCSTRCINQAIDSKYRKQLGGTEPIIERLLAEGLLKLDEDGRYLPI